MRIIATLVVTLLTAVLHRLATPAVSMAVQDTVVGQMQNTDSSTLAVMYAGNGLNWLDGICLTVWLVALAIIWRSTILRALKKDKS